MTSIKLLQNAQLVTMENNQYSIVNHGAMLIEKQKIIWVGQQQHFSKAQFKRQLMEHAEIIDCQNAWVTPGLIDCHTHLIYGGHRANEFEQRLQGKSYRQIAEEGGGIAATVEATRRSDEDNLFSSAKKRLLCMMKNGCTSLEIKSGYGLDIGNELKILRVAKQIQQTFNMCIQKTFLGAHALPSEFASKDHYIEWVVEEALPKIKHENLADAVDAFCETIGFTALQCEKVLKKAKELNFAIKLHAEQLSNQSGALMAAKIGALSVDHLEYLAPQDIPALSKHETVATLLPAAFYFLREKQLPPVNALRQAQVPIALATDCNPGSAPCVSLLQIMNLGCVEFGLTPEEALLGVTQNAAKALGWFANVGSLAAGKRADIAIWDIDHPRDLAYQMGCSPLQRLMIDGHWVNFDNL
ncbi:MAG: imidazolonepropionase [Pseudomonadota bacterium]